MQLNLLDASEIGTKPFFPWVGGKARVVKWIARQYPKDLKTYYEPFVGGGAVFFALAPNLKHAVLSDKNVDIMMAYDVVKNRPIDTCERMRQHVDDYLKDEDYFMHLRAQTHHTDPLERGTRFIFLMKTCFNAIYSVNKEGNLSMGEGMDSWTGKRYRHWQLYTPADIMNASSALQCAELRTGGFDQVIDPQEGDFVYCDPPYDSTKIKYSKDDFGPDGQIALRDNANKWRDKGARVMISNSLTDNIKELYADYRLQKVRIVYTISPSAGEPMDPTEEALLMSYPERP